MNKKRLLLHSCCAPCATHPVKLLSQTFQVDLFFYNPNIHPEKEYDFRLKEIRDLGLRWHFNVIDVGYGADFWFEKVKGLENEPERGQRCTLCFRLRLEETARMARERGYDLFTTTLSISPLKNAGLINQLGDEAAQKFGVAYYPADFKKKDGFKISCELSRQEGLYRQDYCGCLYSMRERDQRRKNNESV